MNVATIEVDQAQARSALKEYRDEVKRTHHRLDEQILAGYKQIAKGRKLIHLPEVLKAGGMNDNGYPRLAVARANQVQGEVTVELQQDGHGTFNTGSGWYRTRHDITPHRVRFPVGTFPWDKYRNDVKTIVPLIPPAHRPARGLALYHILFEVDHWNRIPAKDPALIRHLGGDLWVLVSTWDLTDLERAVLAGR
jgi:hypothetical protein